MLQVQSFDGSTRDVTDADVVALAASHMVFEIMGKEGDVKKIWNPASPVEVEDAKRSFDELKKKGYRAFKTNANGDQGEQMDSFDAASGRVIMVPPMAGG